MPKFEAQEDGSITYVGADDITVVEPITHSIQTAGGYYRDEPDHDLAALFAAAPDLLAALQKMVELCDDIEPDEHKTAECLRMARAAIHRATHPEYWSDCSGRVHLSNDMHSVNWFAPPRGTQDRPSGNE